MPRRKIRLPKNLFVNLYVLKHDKMKRFPDNDFLLQDETARELFHEHAEGMPIIDYHCHLDPKMIAEDYRFADITEAWLGGDHYKWRAMRANGVSEDYITGNKDSHSKFMKWAETLPYTMCNPLYIWTHLELSRIFGIDKPLNPTTAEEIYEACNEKLQTEAFSVRNIMRRMHVETVCTTDDPADSLEYHKKLQEEGFEIHVKPAWRPDKAMAIDKEGYNDYLSRLEKASDMEIITFKDLIEALRKRHEFFASLGCSVSDHGLSRFYACDYTDKEIEFLFLKGRAGKQLEPEELEKFRSAILYELAVMDAESGWVQQFHIGPNRNNNLRMFKKLGADTGFDAIGDESFAEPMNRFFSRLYDEGHLTKTILYNINPRDNELMVANAYNYNDGSVPGKMQYGAAWWFMDQRYGMKRQLEALSGLGLLSRFVGMLTDSRSFLSYPRHEYFRRILCHFLAERCEEGEIPTSELPFVGKMVEDISYRNAKSYFGW
jgi:glucuronate isomerase